jgi:hypothetical protein
MVFHFIENSNRDPATRKLIRSHVMKGKNAGKSRLRSAREPEDENLDLISELSANSRTHGLTKKRANALTPPLGNSFSCIEFAWEVEPSMLHLVHQCMA